MISLLFLRDLQVEVERSSLLRDLVESMGLKGKVGVNVSHVWDDLNSAEPNSGIRNLVWSVDFDVAVLDKEKYVLSLVGETGRSSLVTKENGETDRDQGDSFLDIGLKFEHEPTNLTFTAAFVDIGPDFFSIAAQSKRVDLEREKFYFDRVTNDRIQRPPTLFDLGHDRALYTFQLSDQLMPYDPRFSNVLPYGKATPNRRGVNVGVGYADKGGMVEANLDAAILTEIRGQGTFELKDFTQLRAVVNLNIHRMVDWDKNFRFTLGWQLEDTKRGGEEIEQIDFGSNMFEGGLEIELFQRFDLLLGGKFLTASGTEYVPVISEFNTVQDFPERLNIDNSETWAAAGVAL